MKKNFTLLTMLLTCASAWAQVVFTDGSGKVYNDGQTMTIKADVDPEYGDVTFAAPQLKNNGSTSTKVQIEYTIISLPSNTKIAECFDGTCTNRTTGTFKTGTKSINAGQSISSEIEWNNYYSRKYIEGTASVSMTIYEGNTKGATITVNYVYSERPQILIGLYTSDEITNKDNGYALYDDMATLPDTVVCATFLPADLFHKMDGAQFETIRFALANQAQIASAAIYKVTEQGTKPVSYQPIGSKMDAGWHEVTLSASCPIESDAVGYLVGYTYYEDGIATPVAVNANYSAEMGWLALFEPAGYNRGFYDFSAYGVLAIQAYVSATNIPDVDIILSNLQISKTFLSAEQDFSFSFSLSNYGIKEVSTYQIDVLLDGEVFAQLTETSQVEITPATIYIQGKHTLPQDAKRGAHELSVKVVSANGTAPTVGQEDDEIKLSFNVFDPSDAVTRQKHLIEEMTSNSCTYCPMGATVLETMQEISDDLAIACLHGSLKSRDPYNTDEVEEMLSYLGLASYPSATFNRNYQYEDGSVNTGIAYEQPVQAAKMLIGELEENSMPAFASVNIETSIDGEKLQIKVSGQGSDHVKEYLKDFSITVYVLENGLVYKQLNNGTWVSNYTHNHVVRKIVTALNGDDIKWTSASAYGNEWSVALDPSWNKDQLHVLAFLSKRQPVNRPDFTDMSVTNANVKKLTNVNADGGNTEEEEERYLADLRLSPTSLECNLMGEAMSPNQKFVVGSNYQTYAPCLWDTEKGSIYDYEEYEEGTFHAVNNQGLAVGNGGDFALAFHLDGTPINLEKQEHDAGTDAWCVSEDGKIIAGFYFDEAYKTTPCYWDAEGKRHDLVIPSSKEAGFNVSGAEVRYMSLDGSILAGFIIDDMSTWPAAIWRRNQEGQYECEIICKDYFTIDYTGTEGKYFIFTTTGISADGKWLALNVQKEFEGFGGPAIQAARMNLETKELQILTMPDPITKQSMAATGIANDGTLLLYTDIDGLVGRQGFIWPAGADAKPVDLDEVVALIDGFPKFVANVPCTISSDGSMIQGFGIDYDSEIFSYIIDYKKYQQKILDLREVVAPTFASKSIYTLSGKRTAATKPGLIYIINGKKNITK